MARVELQPVSYRLLEAVVDGRRVPELDSDVQFGVNSDEVGIAIDLSKLHHEGSSEPGTSVT